MSIKKIKYGLSLFLGCLLSFVIHAEPLKNFGQAKKMARLLFQSHRQTLYCHCSFNARLEVDLGSCNMQSALRFPRARRIEFEHMMPAENFGQHFSCWREKVCLKKNGKRYKGRACCERNNKQFRQAEAELYNLWPAVGLVNQARSNYRYNQLEPHSLFYGCPITIDPVNRQVEPADFAKGTVARANLFMADKYQITLSDAQRKLFTAWNQQFPPDSWEMTWAEKVRLIEGYANPYIVNRVSGQKNITTPTPKMTHPLQTYFLKMKNWFN